MKDYEINRRQFLKIITSLPITVAIGCRSEPPKSAVQASHLSPEESLKKLILLLGPWSFADREKAEDFAGRFLKAKHAIAPYLPGSSKLVQTLASRFPAQTIAMREINLQNLPAKERELLVKLVKQLYSFIEVRFIASNEPPWGDCQGDGAWHTYAPKRGKV